MVILDLIPELVVLGLIQCVENTCRLATYTPLPGENPPVRTPFQPHSIPPIPTPHAQTPHNIPPLPLSPPFQTPFQLRWIPPRPLTPPDQKPYPGLSPRLAPRPLALTRALLLPAI